MSSVKEAHVSPDTEAVRPFARLGREDVAYAGGKGANLGELTSAGLPVPDGFVVGAPAYAAFCTETGLRERLADAARRRRRRGHRRAASRQRRRARAVRRDADAGVAAAGRSVSAYERAGGRRFRRAGGGALLGDRRGHRRVFVRGDERDLPEHPRRRRRDRRRAPLLALAVRRAHDLLPRSQRLRPGRHGHRRRRAAPARLDARRRDVHRQPGHRRARRARDRGLLRPGRGGRLGLGLARPLRGGEGDARDPPPRGPPQGARDRIRARRRHPASARSPRRRRCARSSPTRRSWRWPSSAGASRSTTARPQDTEWAFDPDGVLWMLQSRPITTLHDAAARRRRREPSLPSPRPCCCAGSAARPAAPAAPRGCSPRSPTPTSLNDGDVLVTHMTSPDWLPLMRRASADRHRLRRHDLPRGDRLARAGHPLRRRHRGGDPQAARRRDRHRRRDPRSRPRGRPRRRAGRGAARRAPAARALAAGAGAPVTATQILVNLSEPSQVERVKDLPVDGVGLLRAELMVLEALAGDHPRTLLEEGRGEEFVARMAEGLSTFAAGFAPRPVTYRTIDFRTNEFSGLRGGERFEPHEANPMIGYRGALRYTREPDVFALELEALRQVWDDGLHNLHVMLPFVRTHARAAPLPRADRRVRPARSTRLRAVGDGRGALRAVQPRALRRARRHRHLDRLQRPHAAAARRRSRQRGAGRDLRRARPGGHRLPARADSPRATARAAHVDLRPGSLGAPGVRRAAGARRHRRDLGQRRRASTARAGSWPPPSSACCLPSDRARAPRPASG